MDELVAEHLITNVASGVIGTSLVYYCDFLTAGSVVQIPLLAGLLCLLLRLWLARLSHVASIVLGFVLVVFGCALWACAPLPLTAVVLLVLLVENVVRPWARYLTSDGADEDNLRPLLSRGLFTFSAVATATVFYKAALLRTSFVGVLFLQATRICLVAGAVLTAAWVFLPEGRGRDSVNSAVASVGIALFRVVSIVGRGMAPLRILVKTLGRIETDFIKRRRYLRGRYRYRSIRSREIRLLRLTRRKLLAEVSCELICVNLDAAPPYEATSYTWSHSEQSARILVDGSRFNVTPEVYKMLRYRQSLLTDKLLWIDALCIDQKNITEKGRQVGMMREIFSRASRVVAWLGSPDEVPDAFLARSLLVKMSYLRHIRHDYDYINGLANLREDPGWSVLAKLYSHRWFSRVWVVQEVFVAETLHVMYGGVCIDWRTLVDVMGVAQDLVITGPGGISNTTLTVSEQRERLTHFWNAGVMARHREQRRSLSLAEAFIAFRRFQSSEPSDKVFALLGISNQSQLVPDYHTPFQEVYRKAACAIFSKSPFLILPLAGIGYPRFTDLAGQRVPPSWVPDLRYWERGANPVLGELDSWHVQTEYEHRTAPTGGTINLEGAHVADVQTMGNVYESFVSPDNYFDINQLDRDLTRGIGEWYWEAKAIARQGSRDPYTRTTTESLDDAIWRTLVCNRAPGQSPAPAELADCCADWEWQLNTQLAQQQPADLGMSAGEVGRRMQGAARFCFLLGLYSLGKRFCVTSGGYLAIVPPRSQEGDMVCIMRGSSIPYLLRPKKGPAARHYELVGSCYVHRLVECEMENAAMTRFILE